MEMISRNGEDQQDLILDEENDIHVQKKRRSKKYIIIIALSAVIAVIIVLSTVIGVLNRDNSTSNSREVVYFIAADEVLWDYAPYGKNMITGKEFTNFEKMSTQNSSTRIGGRNYKAIYREYTDETFSTLKERQKDDLHLGILGPIIRASVGDSIRVHFKNNAAFPCSLHPHGVLYTKQHEGSAYSGSSGNQTNHGDIAPGDSHIYEWEVPERSGPGPSDFSSILWLYHSHRHEERDVDSGLIGGLIITKRGMANVVSRKPIDVDREFVVMLKVFDESNSWYFNKNLNTFVGNTSLINKKDPNFIMSNNKHAINGFLFEMAMDLMPRLMSGFDGMSLD